MSRSLRQGMQGLTEAEVLALPAGSLCVTTGDHIVKLLADGLWHTDGGAGVYEPVGIALYISVLVRVGPHWEQTETVTGDADAFAAAFIEAMQADSQLRIAVATKCADLQGLVDAINQLDPRTRGKQVP